MAPPARYLVSNPCEDACATLTTNRRVEGAPVYLCPGCDSEWIELRERTTPAEASTLDHGAASTDADQPSNAGPLE